MSNVPCMFDVCDGYPIVCYMRCVHLMMGHLSHGLCVTAYCKWRVIQSNPPISIEWVFFLRNVAKETNRIGLFSTERGQSFQRSVAKET